MGDVNPERRFDSFTQADASTSLRFGGSDLGLAISKRLAGTAGLRPPPASSGCYPAPVLAPRHFSQEGLLQRIGLTLADGWLVASCPVTRRYRTAN